jgi:serine protease Do
VISADGAAMLAGIDEGDVIAAVNGRPVSAVRDFDSALAAARAAGARTVALLVVREGVRAYLPVHMGEEPPAAAQAPLAP